MRAPLGSAPFPPVFLLLSMFLIVKATGTDRQLSEIRDEEEVNIEGLMSVVRKKEANRDTGGTAWNGWSILPRTMFSLQSAVNKSRRVSLGSCVHFLNCLFVPSGLTWPFVPGACTSTRTVLYCVFTDMLFELLLVLAATLAGIYS